MHLCLYYVSVFVLYLCLYCICVCNVSVFVMYLCLYCICVCNVSVFVLYLCLYCLSFDIGLLDLDTGRLARSQNPEGPATGHPDTGFLGFPGS